MSIKHSSGRWDNLGEITSKSWTGEVKVYPNLETAVRNIKVGNYYRQSADIFHYGYLRYHSSREEWAGYYFGGGGDTINFFTSEGVLIPGWKIQEVLDNLPYEPSYRTYYSRRTRHRKWKFRQGPVPGTRCWRGGGGYYRGIQTHQEMRENDFVNFYDEDTLEYDIKTRGRRTRSSLPTRWDDIGRSDYGQKSWKRHRRTQYKTVNKTKD